MPAFLHRLAARRSDEKGASAVEYGLLVAAIAALIVVAVFGIGKVVSGSFSSTCTSLSTQTSTTASC
jgi:pilus assembly protein Flp/PilA